MRYIGFKPNACFRPARVELRFSAHKESQQAARRIFRLLGEDQGC